jgi:membrane protease YdiL (CAAX protease family)
MLFKRLLIWRVGVRWYMFVLFWPAVLSLAKTGIGVVLGGAVPDFSQPPFVQLYPLPPELLNTVPFIVFLPFVFLQQMLMGSSMGEEPGWRGFALPRMQAHQSSLRASLLLGLFWGVWHLPLWLTKGHPMQETFWGWSVLGLMATAVLFTWVYNHTKGSLLLALLFHTSIAITGLFLASAETYSSIEVALNWGVAIIAIAVSSPKHLSREAVGA